MKKLFATIALTIALVIGFAPAANAYTWSQKWYNPQTGKYWAYKNCTREEWFNGCTNGWYQSSWHWVFWG